MNITRERLRYMSNYFWNGLEHFIIAIIFAFIYDKLTDGKNLKKVSFLVGLIVSSSAIFFLPLHIVGQDSFIDKVYQYLHYPISDWDILLFGMGWHRFFITHSLLIFLVIILLIKKPEQVYLPVIIGIGIGLSSHLVWDGLSCSMKTPVVFIASFLQFRGYWAKGWLLLNGIILFIMTLDYAKKYLEE